MRPSRIACLALAALEVLVFASQAAPGRGAALEARVPSSARQAKAAAPRGGAVQFRPRGDVPAPAPARTASLPAASATRPAEAPVDDSSFAYLGEMTSPEGKKEYFFKRGSSGRVQSSGGAAGIKVLEASEKEFLIEIDGTKYRVAR